MKMIRTMMTATIPSNIDAIEKQKTLRQQDHQRNSSIQWSEDVVRVNIIPRLDVSLIDELFYQEDEIAEMRHEAFMLECGLTGDGYCQTCFRMKGPVDDDDNIYNVCNCDDGTSKAEKIEKNETEFEVNIDPNREVKPHEEMKDARLTSEIKIIDFKEAPERTIRDEKEYGYNSPKINELKEKRRKIENNLRSIIDDIILPMSKQESVDENNDKNETEDDIEEEFLINPYTGKPLRFESSSRSSDSIIVVDEGIDKDNETDDDSADEFLINPYTGEPLRFESSSRSSESTNVVDKKTKESNESTGVTDNNKETNNTNDRVIEEISVNPYNDTHLKFTSFSSCGTESSYMTEGTNTDSLWWNL